MANNNALFRSMEAGERRVAIAKDVIKQLRTGRLLANQGAYIKSNKHGGKVLENAVHDNVIDSSTQLSKALPDTCKVCALGGIMIAAVDHFNACKISDLNIFGLRDNGNDDSETAYWWRTLIHLDTDDFGTYITKFFSKKQLDMIETAFEQSFQETFGSHLSDNLLDQLADFSHKYRKADVRMAAIMKNIVENEGTFKPGVSVKRMPKGFEA